MTEQVYKDLLDVMISRRGPYSGMDIPEFFELVEVLFAPQEAQINNVLPAKPAAAGDIAVDPDIYHVSGTGRCCHRDIVLQGQSNLTSKQLT